MLFFKCVVFSPCLFFSIFLLLLSASHFLPLLSLSLSLCICGVFLSFPGRWWLQSDVSWLHSQAKHQNTQHWWVTRLLSLSCCKWMPIARSWSIFGCGCKVWFVYQSLWNWTNHLLGFYSMVGKRKSTGHSWLMSKVFIFFSLESFAIWVTPWTQQCQWSSSIHMYL